MTLPKKSNVTQDSISFTNMHKVMLDKFLLKILPKNTNRLYQAINYSVLNGGKRLRAMLIYATGTALGANLDFLHLAAASVELVHAYSLIHDDLPAMDNDDIRRGKPSCHKKFDDATAILAGDALQTLAFSVLLKNNTIKLPNNMQINMLNTLADAIGIHGMVYGQALDLAAETSVIDIQELTKIHQYKTGALIKACILLGMHAANITPQHAYWDRLSAFGEKIGLVFQIVDDILEATTDSQTLGKNSESDLKNNKTTFVALLGINNAKATANKLIQEAFTLTQPLGEEFKHLRYIADYFINRNF
jgi:geranylgeranyl pyrophosphate synthase